MANALFDLGRQGFLDGTFDWQSSTIKVMLCTSAYTPNLTTDEFVSDIPGGAQVARSTALTSKTEAAGVADAADVTFASVTGSACDKLIIYVDTGSDASSRLIAKIDSATGLPITPSGGAIAVSWDNTAGLKIFKL